MLFFPTKIFLAMKHEPMTQHHLDIDGSIDRSIDTWKCACLRVASMVLLFHSRT